jgi:hypothetical protein
MVQTDSLSVSLAFFISQLCVKAIIFEQTLETRCESEVMAIG